MMFLAEPFLYGGKAGMTLRLQSVQVINLVEFTGKESKNDFEDEEGFTYEGPEEGDGDY